MCQTMMDGLATVDKVMGMNNADENWIIFFLLARQINQLENINTLITQETAVMCCISRFVAKYITTLQMVQN